MRIKLSYVPAPRGAQMGRRNVVPVTCLKTSPKLHLEKLRWVSGDYDQGGCYWGRTWVNDTSVKTTWGTFKASFDVYHASNAELGIEIFVRAISRKEAKKEVRSFLRKARFYN